MAGPFLTELVEGPTQVPTQLSLGLDPLPVLFQETETRQRWGMEREPLKLLWTFLNYYKSGYQPALDVTFFGREATASSCAGARNVSFWPVMLLWGSFSLWMGYSYVTITSSFLFDPDSAVVHWKPRPIYEEKKSGFNRNSANESTSQGRKGQKKGTFSAPLLLKILIVIPAGALAVHTLHQYVCRRWKNTEELSVGTALCVYAASEDVSDVCETK